MYYFNKENTFLKAFDEHTQRGYDKTGNNKWLFWFITYLIATAVQFIPMFTLIIALGILIGVFYRGTDSSLLLASLTAGPLHEWFFLALPTLIVILSFWIYIRLIEKRAFSTIGLQGNKKFIKYLKGAAIAIIMQLAYFIIVMLMGWGEVLSDPFYATEGLGIDALGFVLLFLIGFMIQGASEEVVVRGWMLPVLSKHYKISTAIILSSLYFGFLHILNNHITFLSIINLILYGLFAALYALYDDGLWGIFANHSIWNWFMGNILGLPVSGSIIGKVSIIETNLTGPAWITGGAFGPEGGIIVTFILLLSIAIVLRLLVKKSILLPA
ncbi:MAG: type II CAAX endopeptidase family protein [Thermotaleaceae bacterium]